MSTNQCNKSREDGKLNEKEYQNASNTNDVVINQQEIDQLNQKNPLIIGQLADKNQRNPIRENQNQSLTNRVNEMIRGSNFRKRGPSFGLRSPGQMQDLKEELDEEEEQQGIDRRETQAAEEAP